MTDTARLNRQQAAVIAETAIQVGVTHAVLSPGARNTPLVLALHDMREAGWPIQLHSVLDERAAAFFALGIARRTDTPVLLSCTSGSAGANYFPAVVEASQGEVPLLIVTADRPAELHDRGAPQTMPQTDLFGTHTRFFAHLECPQDTRDASQTQEIVSQAIRAALGPAPGPVHLNVEFRKPLWEPSTTPLPPDAIQPWVRTPVSAEEPDIRRLLDAVAGKSGVIVVGPDPSERISSQAVGMLSRLLGWPILADPVTCIRHGENAHVIHHHDVLFRSPRIVQELKAEIAITLGGTTSSKPLSQVLSDTPCIHIGGSGRRQDPWNSVLWTLKADLSSVVDALARQPPQPTSNEWMARWTAVNQAAKNALLQLRGNHVWEGSIAQALVDTLPAGSLLRLASSTPIRDVDSFSTNGRKRLTVSSNRGVNGIDGLISTSLGEALAHDGPTAVLAGDLSFLHDVGALATVPRPKQSVVITVVDNGGGGIFGFLPMAQHPTGFEPWFITPHNQDLAQICAGFGVRVQQVDTLDDYTQALQTGLCEPGLQVIHVPVERISSTEEHARCFEQVIHAVERSL